MPYGETDLQPLPSGDLSFSGVDMRTDPQQLSQGVVSYARNARFRRGRAEPRLGVWPLRFTFFNAFQWPCEWEEGDINWSKAISIGRVFGIGTWDDPNGRQWQLFVAQAPGDTNCTVWAGAQGNRVRRVSTELTLPLPEANDFPSQSSLDRFWFTAAFNRCFLHSSDGVRPMVMDDIGTGFVAATGATTTDPDVFEFPASPLSLYFQNRLCVPYKPTGQAKEDSVAVSDVLSYQNFSIFNSFRINQGDSDEIVGLRKYNDNTVIVFKGSSIYSVSNLVGDWSVNASLDTITTEYGLVGRRSVVEVGRDLWFLSQRGVTSLVRTADNRIQGTDQPISSPMQPMIDRINFFAAKETACAGYFKDRYYLSIPIDGSYINNTVLVYDFLNRSWSGFDTTSVKYFYTADQNGTDALHYVDYDGNVGLYEYCEEDGRVLSNQANYCVDVTVKSHPRNGAKIIIGGGEEITANTSIETNSDSAGFNYWGIGSDTDSNRNPAADNLFRGFSGPGSAAGNSWAQWDSRGATVFRIDGGVRLCTDRPLSVSTDDPYIYINNSADQALEATPIDFSVTTRAYGYAGGGQGRWKHGLIHVSTWDPRYTVRILTDGAFEEHAWVNDLGEVAYVGKDRTKYLGFGIEDWDISNPNKDFAVPGREDYSVVLPLDQFGGGTLLGDEGVELSQYQFYTNKFLSNRRGAYYQINITNLNGRIRLHAAGAVKTQGEVTLSEHGALH